jgi:hypothetical protein
VSGTLTRFATPATIVVLVAAGCGSGSNEHELTQAEFEQRMAQILKNANERLSTQGDRYFQGGGPEKPTERGFVDQVVTPIFEHDVIGEVEALDPPKDQQDEIQAIVAAAQEALDTLAEDPRLIKTSEGSERDPFRKLSELIQPYQHNDRR